MSVTAPKGAPQPRSGRAIERGEAPLGKLLLTLAWVVGPVLLLAGYYKVMFVGLLNGDALDFAQLGRNLAAGHGFVTYILRPLALTHGSNPLHQPEVTHGPLYPLLLAISFVLFGAKDSVVIGVSGFFYLLTIPVLYRLGMRAFNRTVAVITTLIFIFNALLLEYAASGLNITLYVFLTTSLLLAMFDLAAAAGDTECPRSKIRSLMVLSGVISGLLYLADPMFLWVLPVTIFASARLVWRRERIEGVWHFVPLAVVVLPWMLRNWALTGNPLFGLRGMEVWMYTRDHYPGILAYRMTMDEMVRGAGLLDDIVRKILLGTGEAIQHFPEVTASWVLAFLLPCALFRFTSDAANQLRSLMFGVFFAILLGSLLFGIQMPLFVCVLPAMLVFSVAYLLHLIEQAGFTRQRRVVVGLAITVVVVFPVMGDMFLTGRPAALTAADPARSLEATTSPHDVIVADSPWLVAWYANRPSLWIPANDVKLGEFRDRFPDTRTLFLTEGARHFSQDWESVYVAMWQWDLVYQQQRLAKKRLPTPIRIDGKGPLLEALQGFTPVLPDGTGIPAAVIATRPSSEPQVGAAGSVSDGATARAANGVLVK